MSNKLNNSNSIDIKSLLESNSFAVVLDTNILLNLYRVSPDYAELCIKCLERINEYLYLPSIVHYEFNKNHIHLYNDRNKSFSKLVSTAKDGVDKQIEKIESICKDLKRRRLPEIDDFLDDIQQSYEDIKIKFDEYQKRHSEITFLNKSIWDEDVPEKIVKAIVDDEHIFPELSGKEIMDICVDGQDRYQRQQPPGFKDAKNKDGVRKYSDLIWWQETLRYSKKQRKNIILVTDDVKEDWWQKDGSSLIFHKELFEEFNKKTSINRNGITSNQLQLVPLTSFEFYEKISSSYSIRSKGSVELYLNKTLEKYMLDRNADIVEMIEKTIRYSDDLFLEMPTLTKFGSEGVDEWNINECTLTDYEITYCDAEIAIYELTYYIEMDGESFDYWGRDEDTKEIILSPPMQHVIHGDVKVILTRYIDENNSMEETESEYEISNTNLTEKEFYDSNSGLDME